MTDVEIEIRSTAYNEKQRKYQGSLHDASWMDEYRYVH